MKPPAFQFYAAEYLADEHVQLMTLEEEGAYIRLLAFCWREGSIPQDITALSRLCKGASTTVLTTVVKRFKPIENGQRLVHPRLENERKKQQEWREKSALGGKASAHKRKHPKPKADEQGGATKSQPHGSTNGQAARLNSSSSSSSTVLKKKEEPSAFAGFMKFLANKIGPIPNPAKEGKAIKWLIDNSYDFALCCRCFESLESETWRTSSITWTTVKAEIGGWLSRGPNGNGKAERFDPGRNPNSEGGPRPKLPAPTVSEEEMKSLIPG